MILLWPRWLIVFDVTRVLLVTGRVAHTKECDQKAECN